MMVIILMGVAGCGKTTIGTLLAEAIGWPFYDGDHFHPEANVKKMASGIPLNDQDREPWLRAIQQFIHARQEQGEAAIIACSALKAAYRDILRAGNPNVEFVHLKGDFAVIAARLAARKGHYMPPTLLNSQFDALQEPTDAFIVDIAPPPEQVVNAIRTHFGV